MLSISSDVGIQAFKVPESSVERFRGLFFREAGAHVDTLQDAQQVGYSWQVEEGVLQFIEDVASKKIEVRAHPQKTLHAKIHIFRPEPFSEHKSGSVITGSSNLTHAGLGGDGSNYEFNVLLNDYDDVLFATGEFEKF